VAALNLGTCCAAPAASKLCADSGALVHIWGSLAYVFGKAPFTLLLVARARAMRVGLLCTPWRASPGLNPGTPSIYTRIMLFAGASPWARAGGWT